MPRSARRPGRPGAVPAVAAIVATVVLAGVLAACGAPSEPQGTNPDPAQVDAVETPDLGACRVLEPEDVAAPTNAGETVPCSQEHTAETFAIGDLPARLSAAPYDAPEVARAAYTACSTRFEKFLGADESLVMRTAVSWAWFRPSQEAWDDGARWYRCDVVGGGEQSASYVALPETAKGLLLGRPDDRWLVCAPGETITSEPKVPCSEKHQWRAVTTIKVGEPGDPYPGDREVEVTTRDFCSDSVGAWLNYPVEYDYAYTFFHEAEWQAGNRRSVCWARTPD